jgi:hypothetical protein
MAEAMGRGISAGVAHTGVSDRHGSAASGVATGPSARFEHLLPSARHAWVVATAVDPPESPELQVEL